MIAPRRGLLLLLACLALALGPGGAVAQKSKSKTLTGPIELSGSQPRVIEDRLVFTSRKGRSGKAQKYLIVRLEAGRVYRFEVSGPDNAPSLLLNNSEGQGVARATAKRGARKTELVYGCPKAGSYILLVSTVESVSGSVPFTLTIQQEQGLPTATAFDPSAVTLPFEGGKGFAVGHLTPEEPRDRVHADSYRKTFTLALNAGTTYRIELRSTKLALRLRLEGADGKSLAEQTAPARVTWHCTRTGLYRVIATTTRGQATGNFVIAVEPVDETKLSSPPR